jgi:hypothetical protein
MQDLLRFLIALMVTDEELQSIFQAAGASLKTYAASGSSYVGAYQTMPRIPGEFPRIVVSAEFGTLLPAGDNRPKLLRGSVDLDIMTRQDTTLDPTALTTLRSIQNRLFFLFFGNPTSVPSTPGVRGQHVSNQYTCAEFRQISPTGDRPSVDPTIFRYGMRIECLINNSTM